MHSLQKPIKLCFPAITKRICLAKGKPIRHKHAALFFFSFFFAVACHKGNNDLKVLIKPANFQSSVCLQAHIFQSFFFNLLFLFFKFPVVVKRHELDLG